MNKDEVQKLKVFTINYLSRMNKRQELFLAKLEQARRSDDLLTVNDVAEQYSVSPKTVYRWRDKGLEHYQNRAGGKLLFRRNDLDNFINAKYYGRLF